MFALHNCYLIVLSDLPAIDTAESVFGMSYLVPTAPTLLYQEPTQSRIALYVMHFAIKTFGRIVSHSLTMWSRVLGNVVKSGPISFYLWVQ